MRHFKSFPYRTCFSQQIYSDMDIICMLCILHTMLIYFKLDILEGRIFYYQSYKSSHSVSSVNHWLFEVVYVQVYPRHYLPFRLDMIFRGVLMHNTVNGSLVITFFSHRDNCHTNDWVALCSCLRRKYHFQSSESQWIGAGCSFAWYYTVIYTLSYFPLTTSLARSHHAVGTPLMKP